MKRLILIAWMLLALLALSGCAHLEPEPAKMSGVSIVDMSVKLGGNSPVQTVSYTFTVLNGTPQEVQVDWVKPVVDAAFKTMLGEQNLTQALSKKIPAGERLEVSGNFQIKTNGIPPDQLAEMGMVVKSFAISSRAIFAAPTLQAESPQVETGQPASTKAEKPAKAKATRVP